MNQKMFNMLLNISKNDCEKVFDVISTIERCDEIQELLSFVELSIKEKIYSKIMFYPIEKKCMSLLMHLFVQNGYTTNNISNLHIISSKGSIKSCFKQRKCL